MNEMLMDVSQDLNAKTLCRALRRFIDAYNGYISPNGRKKPMYSLIRQSIKNELSSGREISLIPMIMRTFQASIKEIWTEFASLLPEDFTTNPKAQTEYSRISIEMLKMRDE